MKRILVVLTALLLVGPTAAEATDPPGTYVVSSCQLGDQPIPLVGWFRESANDPHLLDSCGTRNGSFGASPNGQLGWASGERYRWLWNAPADTAVSGVRVWGVSGSAPGRFGLIGGWFSAGDVTIDLPGGIRPTENLAVNTTQLSLAVGCGGLEGCLSRDEAPPSGGSSRPAGVTVSRMEILLRDVVPPEAVSPPTGTLLNGEPLTGTVGVGTSYRDRGGGVQSLTLLIDGVQGTQRLITSGSCRQPSAVAVPCPLSGRLDLDFDTSSISDGPHRAELELRDVAGNRALVGPYPIVVRNIPAPAAPLTPGRLAMKRYSLRAEYGTRAVLEGKLTDFGEGPIAGAQVQVESRPLMRNSTYAPLTTVLTDGSGTFVVPVPRGPSRVFRLRYALSEASAEVIVPAPVTVRVSPTKTRNGKTVRFTGSIPGTAATTRVELQARAGRRWVTFRTATVSRGRFRARYKFTGTTTRQRYRFRAVVRRDPNFPYAAGTSPIVKVLVRP